MMCEVTLSIVIPVYNAEKYIARSLVSILKSDANDFEVIIVDDGSKDDSLNVCGKVGGTDPRLHLYHKTNTGVSSTRNYGISRATGKYVTFCDADDFYSIGGIDKLLSRLRLGNFDMVYYPFCTYDCGNTKEYSLLEFTEDTTVSIEYIKKNFWRLLNSGMINASWNKVFRRKIIETNSLFFPENVTFSEDGIFNVGYLRALSTRAKILYFNDPIYNYAVNPEQATRRRHKNYFDMMCMAFDNIDAFLEGMPKDEEYWKEWFSVIKDTVFHQNYVIDNSTIIADNPRTKNMVACFCPQKLYDKILFKCFSKGHYKLFCDICKRRYIIAHLVKKVVSGGRLCFIRLA